MFTNLDQRAQQSETARERMFRRILVLVVSLVLFTAVFMALLSMV